MNEQQYRFNGTSTVTETEKQRVAEISSAPEFTAQQTQDITYDDYSVTPNYNEEVSYNSASTLEEQPTEVQQIRSINLPNIQKEEQPTVTLLKTKQKLVLTPRLKIVASAFSVVMIAMIVLICYNFASLGGIYNTASKQEVTISELNSSISALKGEYTRMYDDNELTSRAEEAGFVKIDESNSNRIELGEFYEEPEIQDLPSNWFNDVCEFFSNLFS